MPPRYRRMLLFQYRREPTTCCWPPSATSSPRSRPRRPAPGAWTRWRINGAAAPTASRETRASFT